MKFIKFSALFLFLSQSIFGQQTFQFSQYYFNKFIYNPAFAGFEDYVDVKTSYRSQWTGLNTQNKTFYVTASMPIGKTDITSDGPRPFISEKKAISPKKTFIRKKENKPASHQGLGVQLINDVWGPVNTLSLSLSYAFHIPLGGEDKISAGFSLGNYYRMIDLSSGSFDVSDPSDKLLNASGKLSVNQNLVNIGLTYYNRVKYIGLSAMQPIMDTYNFTSKSGDSTNTKNSFGQFPSVFILQGGTRAEINENITLYPSFIGKYINKYQWMVETTVRAMYKESVWAGVSYRLKESAALHVGARLSPSITVNYSYDFQNNIGPFTRSLSSNELSFAYMFYWKKPR
ncbi:MAG: hypothetical protein RI995_791 [Bacteroidota bacterium]